MVRHCSQDQAQELFILVEELPKELMVPLSRLDLEVFLQTGVRRVGTALKSNSLTTFSLLVASPFWAWVAFSLS